MIEWRLINYNGRCAGGLGSASKRQFKVKLELPIQCDECVPSHSYITSSVSLSICMDIYVFIHLS